MSTTAPAADTGQQHGRQHGIVISVRTATGHGRTHLSAFDHALLGAGVGDYNLVTLSSVIPPASRMVSWDPEDGIEDGLSGTHGDRLYCVLAAAYADQPGAEGWAGIGWVTEPSTGAGLFVEHTATSERELRRLLDTSLDDLVANRGGGYPDRGHALSVATCVDRPVCAITLAAYVTAPWSDDAA